MKTFPNLYKKKSKGSITQWSIEVRDNTISTTFGEIGGKFQTYHETISEGKNIGRSNQTSPAEQAEAEAQSAWNYKRDRENYKEDLDSLSHSIVDGGPVMLAHSYEKSADKMPDQLFYQNKLDGNRAKAVTLDGSCRLFSRTGKLITGVPHINRYLEEHWNDTILDGELYNHAYHNDFEQLSSFIRQEEPKPGCEIVQYHVYDVIFDGTAYGHQIPFRDRLSFLQNKEKTLADAPRDVVIIVPTLLIDEKQIRDCFLQSRKENYEGIMVRDPDGLYEGRRSYSLQKVKEMEDSEFEVVGITEGRGKLAGHSILKCSMPDGLNTFDVKLKGPFSYLQHIYQNPNDFIGRMVTVQYQGMTKYGIPRFPVGLRFREDI